MVDHHASAAGHPDMDYGQHEKTYELFIKLIKYVSVSVIVILILLAYLSL
jgi:hypothetical protein